MKTYVFVTGKGDTHVVRAPTMDVARSYMQTRQIAWSTCVEAVDFRIA